jgi:mRNA interferase MazF
VPKPWRGDIVTVAGGVYSSKPRPAVILQDDLFIETDSVTVCPLTTTNVDARRSNVGERIGQLDAVQMLELERRAIVFLGLAH